MKRKLFTLLLALAASVCIYAEIIEHVKIGDLYYNLDVTNFEAEVTYQLKWTSGNYSELTNVIIPSSVTYNAQDYSVTGIGENTFWYCTSLISCTIGDNVVSIGTDAFANCVSLTSVTIPINVASIGGAAFSYCSSLTEIIVNPSNLFYSSEGGVLFDKDKTTLIQYPGGKQGEYSIPNSVTSIGYFAFEGCRLTTIEIPNSVTSLGYRALSGCFGLTEIIVNPSNLFYSSEGGVLFDKDKTTLIQYPGGKQGGYSIPNSVTSIGGWAFGWCSGLTSVTIGSGVTSIGEYAFYYCSGLTSVTIPNSVTSIGNSTFEGCYGLAVVTNYVVTPQEINDNVFYGANISSCTLYVPAESLAAYQAADVWGDFGTIEPIPTTMDISANQDPKNAGDYYSTFYHSSQRYTLPGNGTEAYVADLSGGDLILTRIAQGSQVLPNNVAVILKAPTSTITLTETSAAGVSYSAENDLLGVDAVTPLEDLSLTRSTCYVLSGNSTDGVGFFQCNSDNLKAHKAYLPYAGAPAGAPRRMRFVFNNTTDLDQVQRDQVQSTKILRNAQLIIIRNDVEYNVAGQIVK